MKKAIISTLNAYRQHRAAKAISKAYRIFRYSLTAIFAAYLLTICFPQYLFAHNVAYKNFKVYSREPLDENIYKVLDDAQARLSKSSIYDGEINRRVFLTNGFGMYAFLSSKTSFRSFASTALGIDNIYVNKSDAANDLVFRNRPENNSRSLSGVIAHEVTHLFIKKRVGYARNVLSLPTWKTEGYCEYIAGDSTITLEEGIKRWKENPGDDSKYFTIKYHLMVKYLLETEKLTIDDVFNREFDEKDLAAKVFSSL
jgi:hypothetical protein